MQTKHLNKQDILLSFEFAHATGDIVPFTFRKPLKVITTHRLEEVKSCFKQIQEAVENGYYAAGFLSYESAPAFDSAYIVNKESKMPLLWFGIFSQAKNETLSSSGSYTLTDWKPDVNMDEYKTSIQSIKKAIENGITYQTNYTIRLQSKFQGETIAFFNKLKKAQASNYCAYLNTGEYSILSASPELFFHVKDGSITTRPMKGTIKRGKTYQEDMEYANWLYHSEKNRAENVMIVDLLRNDLGVIAKPGSVKVPKLFEIEQYPTVHQMTSTITAKLPKNMEFFDIFQALFPCGSITGAPKISTMDIISQLEKTPREVYCGAIGYITPHNEAIFNVPIRTVIIDHVSHQATYGVGGGVTWDSTSEDEYQEVLAKAKLLEENRPEFELLESLLLDNGNYFLLDEHLKRLKNSAQYFGFKFDVDDVMNMLHEFANVHHQGMFKVRLLLTKLGEITIEGNQISQMGTLVTVMIAEEPISKNNLFLYHKTTNREVYTYFQNKKPKTIFDVLLWNESREITEFTNGNIVLEIDGQKWTPPVDSGLLAGTFREFLLKKGEIQEKTLTISDLKKATKIWCINSVRKWVEVKLITD